MIIGNKRFELNVEKPNHEIVVMGILNVTPDSFSDGGKWNHPDAALNHVGQMIEEGAGIIDVGGESTRPGYEMISDQEEIERVCPVIEAIKKEYDVPISIDTYKSAVAEAAIKSGANLVNDIWGLKYDAKMADLIAQEQVSCCLMHNRVTAEYDDFCGDLLADLRETLAIAEKAGIPKEQIMLDPGVGFAKNYEQNLLAIRMIPEIIDLGYPVLLGCSRKSVVGLTLDLPKEQRVEGTLATSVLGAAYGATVIRVHDVKENVRAIRMAQAILNVRN